LLDPKKKERERERERDGKTIAEQGEVLRYLNGRSDQHRDAADLRDRSVDQPIRHGDDQRVRADVVPVDLHMATGELGVPHAEEQARARGANAAVDPGQGQRGRGTRGGQADRGDGGQARPVEREGDNTGDHQQAAEPKSLQDRPDSTERIDIDRCGADTRVSIVHLQPGGLRDLHQRQHHPDRIGDRFCRQCLRIDGAHDRQEIAAADRRADLRAVAGDDRYLLPGAIGRIRRIRVQVGAHGIRRDLCTRLRPRSQSDPACVHWRDLRGGSEGARRGAQRALLCREHHHCRKVLSGTLTVRVRIDSVSAEEIERERERGWWREGERRRVAAAVAAGKRVIGGNDRLRGLAKMDSLLRNSFIRHGMI